MSGMVDQILGYGVRMDETHHLIHDAELFRADIPFTASTLMRALITTGTSKFVHLVANIQAQDAGIFEIFEAPTVSAAGTAVTPVNAKRTNTTETLDATITHTPTTSADGTLIEHDTVGDGGNNPNARSGGAGGRDTEWVLKQDTIYMVKFVPDAAANGTIKLQMYNKSGNRDS